jgi:hypothetical protein
MTVIASNDALSKLRQKANRRRLLRYKGAVRPNTNTSAPRRAYKPAEPPTPMIVSDWHVDEFGNLARTIKRA